MNRLETWFCGSAFWRRMTQRQILPWVLADHSLGEHVLELGAGFGATTEELQRKAKRVTSLEYDRRFAANLAPRFSRKNVDIVCGDAALLPFPNGAFSSITAMLVLHHLKSAEQQGKVFEEIHRVLKPGGVLLVFEILDGWLNRVAHIKSTFVPIAPDAIST